MVYRFEDLSPVLVLIRPHRTARISAILPRPPPRPHQPVAARHSYLTPRDCPSQQLGQLRKTTHAPHADSSASGPDSAAKGRPSLAQPSPLGPTIPGSSCARNEFGERTHDGAGAYSARRKQRRQGRNELSALIKRSRAVAAIAPGVKEQPPDRAQCFSQMGSRRGGSPASRLIQARRPR
jgi:hypothetical protein